VNNLIASGVPVVVAAGNANAFTRDFAGWGRPGHHGRRIGSDDMRRPSPTG
jgi:hypothetical protein